LFKVDQLVLTPPTAHVLVAAVAERVMSIVPASSTAIVNRVVILFIGIGFYALRLVVYV